MLLSFSARVSVEKLLEVFAFADGGWVNERTT
jgi:hypothetical protein